MVGKSSEVVRWVVGIVLAAIVSYFTAQNEADRRMTTVDVREQIRWEETARRLKDVETNQLQVRESQQRIELMFNQVIADWARGVDKRTGEPLPLQNSIERRGR